LRVKGTSTRIGAYFNGEFVTEEGRLARSPSSALSAREAQVLEEVRNAALNKGGNLVALNPAETREEVGFGALYGAVIRVKGRVYTCDEPARVSETIVRSARQKWGFAGNFADALERPWICSRSGAEGAFDCRGPIELVEPQDVRVIDASAAEVPASCGDGHDIEAFDGKFSLEFEKSVDGTREVAVERLREKAGNHGWNLVVLDQWRSSARLWSAGPVGGGEPFYTWWEYHVVARAFRCSTTDLPSIVAGHE